MKPKNAQGHPCSANGLNKDCSNDSQELPENTAKKPQFPTEKK